MHANRLFRIIGAFSHSMVTERSLEVANPRIHGGKCFGAGSSLGKKSVSPLPLFRSIVMNRRVAKNMETGSEFPGFYAAGGIERKPRIRGIDNDDSERLVGLTLKRQEFPRGGGVLASKDVE